MSPTRIPTFVRARAVAARGARGDGMAFATIAGDCCDAWAQRHVGFEALTVPVGTKDGS